MLHFHRKPLEPSKEKHLSKEEIKFKNILEIHLYFTVEDLRIRTARVISCLQEYTKIAPHVSLVWWIDNPAFLDAPILFSTIMRLFSEWRKWLICLHIDYHKIDLQDDPIRQKNYLEVVRMANKGFSPAIRLSLPKNLTTDNIEMINKLNPLIVSDF